MNIYNKNKKHWSQVQNEMMGCLHMRMLKNVCLHVISITLSLFGSFVWCFYRNAVQFFHNFGASISQFCASTPMTLILFSP